MCHKANGMILAAAMCSCTLAAQAADVFHMPTGQTNLQFVTVGDPVNAADTRVASDGTTGYGAVGYTYQMGKYDVTLAQYCQFLNAVARTDTYGLYNSYMATSFPNSWGVSVGIARSGSANNYSYSIMGNGNVPVFDVSWGDAARFCNWLQNGQPTGAQGSGTTETGAYSLNRATSAGDLMAVTRNAGATYFIPSEDEWYKAAYYKGGGTNAGYWLYPTQSNAEPSNVLSSTGMNNATFNAGASPADRAGFTDPTNVLTSVGAFEASPGPYGTYDQAGILWQWNDTNVDSSSRGSRGGNFGGSYSLFAASNRNGFDPTSEGNAIGFRVASVPEPGSITLLVCGPIAVLIWRRIRS
jgi:formylglycine-generating enzyme